MRKDRAHKHSTPDFEELTAQGYVPFDCVHCSLYSTSKTASATIALHAACGVSMRRCLTPWVTWHCTRYWLPHHHTLCVSVSVLFSVSSLAITTNASEVSSPQLHCCCCCCYCHLRLNRGCSQSQLLQGSWPVDLAAPVRDHMCRQVK